MTITTLSQIVVHDCHGKLRVVLAADVRVRIFKKDYMNGKPLAMPFAQLEFLCPTCKKVHAVRNKSMAQNERLTANYG